MFNAKEVILAVKGFSGVYWDTSAAFGPFVSLSRLSVQPSFFAVDPKGENEFFFST